MDQSVKLQTIHNKWKNNLRTCVWHKCSTLSKNLFEREERMVGHGLDGRGLVRRLSREGIMHIQTWVWVMNHRSCLTKGHEPRRRTWGNAAWIPIKIVTCYRHPLDHSGATLVLSRAPPDDGSWSVGYSLPLNTQITDSWTLVNGWLRDTGR